MAGLFNAVVCPPCYADEMTNGSPVALALLLTFAAPAAFAELPPDAYAEDQAQASEHLTIRARKVDTRACKAPCRQPVKVEAEVVEVHQSKAGLKAGDRITITYEHNRPPPGWVGPSPVPILKKGETYPAYLSKTDGKKAFAPAAGGYSFSEVR